MMASEIGAPIRAPPGLAPPPGLEHLAPPPGLEPEVEDEVSMPFSTDVVVQLSNMPNHILTTMMMEAMLQQARLDSFVLGFSTTQGVSCGEAFVTLSNRDAAQQCAQHFHTRRWGGNAGVNARVITPERPVASEDVSSKFFSAKAPASVQSFMLSAAAPEFIPGVASKAPNTIDSDVSTADDESSSSDDGEVASIA